MRGRGHATFAGALAATTLLASPVHSDEPPPSHFQFVWVREAGAGCPTPRQAREQVRRWLGRDPFTDDAEQVIEASVLAKNGQFHATVRVRDAQGRPLGRRTIEASGPGCDAIARAALLAVVLTIDPTAPAVPPPLAASAASLVTKPTLSAPPPPTSASASTEPAASAPAASVAPQVLPILVVVPPPPVAPPAARSETRGSLAIGAGMVGRVLPQAGLLVGLTGSVQVSTWLAVEAGAAWLPLRASASGEASFGLTMGRIGACATPLRSSEGAVEGCASVGVGAMTSVVEKLEPLRPGNDVWAAAMVGLRGRLELPGDTFVRLGAEAIVPMRRLDYRITSEPSRTVFSGPWLGGSLTIDLGVHFR